MPIKKAAKKYARITKKRTIRNKITIGKYKSAIKKTKKAVLEGNSENAQKWFLASVKSLDKAVQKGVIKKNTAARGKSRLSSLVKKMISKEKPL